tara:strand:+ start:921 stop:1322 length:402 start_codon:yes stop_codon:yes gene_type:complete
MNSASAIEYLNQLALEAEKNRPSKEALVGTGAVLGGTAGAVLGQVPHSLGNALGFGAKSMRGFVRPGFRLATSVPFGVIGAGAGALTKAGMDNTPSDAAKVLAQLMTGEATEQDRKLATDLIAYALNNQQAIS